MSRLRDLVVELQSKVFNGDLLQIIKIDFDTSENNLGYAIREEVVATFIGSYSKSAFSHVSEWLKNHQYSFYLGVDKQVYPKLQVRKVIVDNV